MSLLVAGPVLIPLATAMTAALAAGRPALQRSISFAGALLLLAATLALLAAVHENGTQRTAFGNWDLPFGIEFAADRLGAAMALITALMGVATLLFQYSDADRAPESPTLHPLIHGLLAGVGGSFVTADLFNLYVWFEVMLITSLGLLALGGAARHFEAAFKYYTLNAVGTLLFLMSVAWLYGLTGQLNFAALREAAPGVPAPLLLPFVAALLLAFAVKAGAFPLYAWLPAAYHTLPAPVLALFAGLLTKVGVYAILRMAADVFSATPALLYDALAWIGVATMTGGVLGAAYHWDMRRILAFHIVSQIGYMLLAIGLRTPAADAATIFYVIHHIIVKANLFLIAAIVCRLAGHYDLRRIGGVFAARPALALLFALPALSLVGIPPLSGFWAKFMLVREALALGHGVWAAAALAVGFLTFYSMMKIWLEAFWKPHPDPAWEPPADARLAPAWVATTGLALLTLAIGVYPQPLIAFAQSAAATLGAPR